MGIFSGFFSGFCKTFGAFSGVLTGFLFRDGVWCVFGFSGGFWGALGFLWFFWFVVNIKKLGVFSAPVMDRKPKPTGKSPGAKTWVLFCTRDGAQKKTDARKIAGLPSGIKKKNFAATITAMKEPRQNSGVYSDNKKTAQNLSGWNS